MKTMEDLEKDIKSTKELLFNSDTGGLVQSIDDRITYREIANNYWLIDFKINNTVIIYVFNNGRVIVSYDYISFDCIEDSMRLYDFIDSLKKEIKNIFFIDSRNREFELINDLLDLTGYEFNIYSCFKNDLIKVSDGYFDFVYRFDDNLFTMNAKSDTFIVFDSDTEDSYNLFKRLDTYKETCKYIKELLENYIKEL